MRTPALRAPTITAYPTKPLPPVIITRGEEDMMSVDTLPGWRTTRILYQVSRQGTEVLLW